MKGVVFLLFAVAGYVRADPDFFSAWCPCRPRPVCPNYYGSSFNDILIFGNVPKCKQPGHERCCSEQNIPEGFVVGENVKYLPEPVKTERESVLFEVERLNHESVSSRQDVIEYKLAVEKLKRDIANGEVNPNPPCGCYTSGTCPGRYATKSTGRDIGCFSGYETCCFLDDPWPNYKVTNLTINAPCAIFTSCKRFFGMSPFDISNFGPLEPCYLGQNRCLDYLAQNSRPSAANTNPVTQIAQQTTKRPTTSRRPSVSRRPSTSRPTTAKPNFILADVELGNTETTTKRYSFTTQTPIFETFTYRPTRRPTYRTTRLRPSTQKPTFRPSTGRPTFRPSTGRPTFRPSTRRPTFRPSSRRPTFTPYTFRTTTQRLETTQQPTTPRDTFRTTSESLAEPSGNLINYVNQGSYLPPPPNNKENRKTNHQSNINFDLPLFI